MKYSAWTNLTLIKLDMLNDPNNHVLTSLVQNNYILNHFYRAPGSKLVYVPMLKCASTYYSNMCQKNNWTQIEFNTINWNSDVVFGFIMNPYRRHIKALVQDLMWLKNQHNLDLEKLPNEFWQLAPVLGVHGLGFSQVYEKFCDKIFWIPLDAEVNSQEIVNSLFQDNNVSWNWNIKVFDHQSNKDQLDLFNRIYRIFDGPGQDWFNITNRLDVLLYQNVLSRFAKTLD